jgi:uncharacterized OsmC-like protein
VHIAAHLRNAGVVNDVSVTTAGNTKAVAIPAKAGGGGSSLNGGELLMLAIATCCCNDIYREAARLQIQVDAVEVEATADFEGIGAAATNIRYFVRIESPASGAQVAELVRQTDLVAEVHNTIRSGATVSLVRRETGCRV